MEITKHIITLLALVIVTGCGYAPDPSTLQLMPHRYAFVGEPAGFQLSSHVTDGVELGMYSQLQTSPAGDDWIEVTPTSTTPNPVIVYEKDIREGLKRAWQMGLITGVEKTPIPGGATVVQIGDSITSNGVITTTVTGHLEPLGVTTQNLAVSGKTWQWFADNEAGIAVIDSAIAENPDVVTWMLGTNGLFTAYPSASGTTGYPAYVDRELEAAERLFERFPDDVTHIIATTPPGNDDDDVYLVWAPYDEPHYPNTGVSTRQRWLERTHELAGLYLERFGDFDNVIIAPVRASIHRTDGYTVDTVHPNGIGLIQIGDALAPAILHALQRGQP